MRLSVKCSTNLDRVIYVYTQIDRYFLKTCYNIILNVVGTQE